MRECARKTLRSLTFHGLIRARADATHRLCMERWSCGFKGKAVTVNRENGFHDLSADCVPAEKRGAFRLKNFNDLIT